MDILAEREIGKKVHECMFGVWHHYSPGPPSPRTQLYLSYLLSLIIKVYNRDERRGTGGRARPPPPPRFSHLIYIDLRVHQFGIKIRKKLLIGNTQCSLNNNHKDGGFFSSSFNAVGSSITKNKINYGIKYFFSSLNDFQSVGRLKKIERHIFEGCFQRICVKFDFLHKSGCISANLHSVKPFNYLSLGAQNLSGRQEKNKRNDKKKKKKKKN